MSQINKPGKEPENQLSDVDITDEDTYVTQAYNIIAINFNETRPNPWDWQKKFMDEHIKDGFYYDIGCGGGRNLKEGQSIGVDSCPEFVKIVQQKGLDCELADMTNLPFEDETADAVMCIAAYHHLSTVERRQTALNEMYRVLRPTGKMMISVWSQKQPPTRKDKEPGNSLVPWRTKQKIKLCDRLYYIFKRDELENLFQEASFKIISYEWDYGNEVYILQKPEISD